MKLPSCLLCTTAQFTMDDSILVLNSASDPFVSQVLLQHKATPGMGTVTLAEDNVALAQASLRLSPPDDVQKVRHVAFHDYIMHNPANMEDIAVMNLLYQPGNAWMLYGVQVAAHALRIGGYLYIAGAKERGILSMAKRVQEYFGHVETLLISKGQRVLRAQKRAITVLPTQQALNVFANNKLDEGTRLLLDCLEVQATDKVLDLGCGAGFIGLHCAQQARQGTVTMVDVSLAAVATTRQAVEERELTNVRVLPGDGAKVVLSEQFDLVVTNPPFHQGGIQTTEIAERFIRETAQVLHPQGRFYLVANRFLKYEPILHTHFNTVDEVGGNTRFKVLRSMKR